MGLELVREAAKGILAEALVLYLLKHIILRDFIFEK
jgi:hypothetical protein